VRKMAVALAFVAAVTACGSGSSGAAAPGSGSPSASGGSQGPTASPAQGPRGSGATSSPKPGATPGQAPLGSSAGGRVVLGRTCLHRGDTAEPQSVTVSAGPGETVTYSTYYSDYSTELNRPDYTTGHGSGQAGSDGRFRASWTVPSLATPGRATVRVTATDMTEDAQEASFLVVKQGERCL